MVYRLERFFRDVAAVLVLFALATAVVVPGPAYAKTRQYDILPAPQWVQAIAVEPNGKLTTDAKDGTAYLLVDRQIRIQHGWSEYDRYVTRAVNAAGVDDASQITIDFDPALDHLILHAVTVRRGAHVIDELRNGRIEVLQRESELEQGLLDGSLTFHLLMSDVRVGDTIDESYTIEHRDPTLGNRFFARVMTRWSSPVARSHLRVLLPQTARLAVGGPEPTAPVKQRGSGWRTLEWNWSALPAVETVDDTPSWYQQYPVIQFSQFTSWKEVVRDTLPLFSFSARDPEVAAVSRRLKASAATESGRALAAARFVQEKIRYTGLELGSGAFRPRSPGEVLRSRYGDCKDKALLAVALLRALGIDAAPALVSTRWQGHLDEQLPSPGDFDHAIVRLRLAGKTYWIDVTETAQGGDLETLDQASYGKALVISPGVAALEAMPVPVPAKPLVAATEVFDLRAGMEAEAPYTVSTIYRGSRANDLRRKLRRTSAAELGETYLNYYKGRYPGISAVRAPDIHDDPLANEIRVNETYRISHPFASQSSGRRRFELEPEVIDDYAQSTDQPVRAAPLSLDYPVDVTQRTMVRLPSYFPIKDEVVKIDQPAFHYESSLTHKGNDVLFVARYRTLADVVPRDQLDAFLDKLGKARGDGSLQFTSYDHAPHNENLTVDEAMLKSAEAITGGPAAGTDNAISMPSIVTLALSLAFGIWCGWRVLCYDPLPKQAEENAPAGIRGFLVLPAIGAVLGPVGALWVMVEWVKLSQLRIWHVLPSMGATSYQSWRYLAYLALLATICVTLVCSCVYANLFFRKRSSAPVINVALMWTSWLYTLGIGLFGAALGLHNHSFTRPVGEACLQAVIAGAWSLYMFRSQRVKATFISRRPAAIRESSQPMTVE